MAAYKQQNSIKKRMGRPSDILAALVLLGLLAGLIVLGLRFTRFLMLDMEEAQAYSQELQHSAQMVVIRSEYPVPAAEAGLFIAALSPGERVRAGDSVGYTEWEGRRQEVLAPHAGLVYYDSDGWESALTPQAMDEISWIELILAMEPPAEEAPEPEEEAVLTASDLSAGRAVARIVDNLMPVYVFLYGGELPFGLEAGESLTFRLSDGTEAQIIATATQAGHLSVYRYVLAEVTAGAAELYQLRQSEVSLAGELISGVAVPLSAITAGPEGQSGVYARKGKYLRFTPVEVIYSDEEIAVVEGISRGMMVAADPQRAQEGQRLYFGK